MTRAEPNVVGDENVAVFEFLDRNDFEKRPDCPRKRPDKGRNAIGRLRDGPTLSVGDDTSEIVRFADNRREGGPNQSDRSFFDDRNQSAPNQFNRDRIQHRGSSFTWKRTGMAWR